MSKSQKVKEYDRKKAEARKLKLKAIRDVDKKHYKEKKEKQGKTWCSWISY